MHARLLIGALVTLLAACGGASPTTPTTTPVAYTPRPSPSSGPWSSGWGGWYGSVPDGGVTEYLVAACSDGTPVPGAAPYAGSVHPLLVIDMYPGQLAYVAINRDFPGPYGWSWASPLQLVVCVERDEKRVESCGQYKSGSEVHEVYRDQATATIRVIEAVTGEVLQQKVLKNPAPKCPKKFWTTSGNWVLVDPVTDEQVDTYATSVSTQSVE
jgi:hypothetical protein